MASLDEAQAPSEPPSLTVSAVTGLDDDDRAATLAAPAATSLDTETGGDSSTGDETPPAAEAHTAEAEAHTEAAAPQAESPPPVLLREWQEPAEPSSPPVAPAVIAVMDDDSQRRSSSGGGYAYPVATFVRDLVRTGMDQISNVAAYPNTLRQSGSSTGGTATTTTGVPFPDSGETLPLSVRSEADAEALAEAVRQLQQQQQQQQQQGQQQGQQHPLADAAAASALSLPTPMTAATDVFEGTDANTEFILVDGDLIALPPLAENHYEQQAVQDALQRQADNEEEAARKRRSSCRQTAASAAAATHPRRMRRGVRKISKFFKRVRRGQGNKSSSSAARSTTPPPSSRERTATAEGEGIIATVGSSSGMTSLEDSAAAAIASAAAAAAQEQLMEMGGEYENEIAGGETSSSTSPKRVKKGRRQRRSWKRKEKEITVFDPYQQQDLAEQRDGGGSGSLRETRDGPPSVAALTGLETPSYTLESHSGSSGSMPQQHLLPSPVDAMARRRRNQGSMDQDPLSPPPTTDAAAAAATAPPSSLAVPPMTPIHEASATDSGYRTQSVTASFVGTTDQIGIPEVGGISWDAGVGPADVAAIAFIESDDLSYWKKDDGSLIPSVLSVVPPDADYKVDKADAPDVESMLMRAAHETTFDLDSSDLPTPFWRDQPRGKSDHGASSSSSLECIPLSQARHSDVAANKHDVFVYNDMLKVVMVAAPGVDKTWIARAVRNSQKRPRKRATLGVDVHSWTPPAPPPAAAAAAASDDGNDTDNADAAAAATEPVKFMIWDVQGATGCPADSANFGAHPGTQSLFFSGQSLYLLCWDLACNNRRTNHYNDADADDDSESDSDDESEAGGRSGGARGCGAGGCVGDDEGGSDAFVREEANKRADRALRADISQRVLSWVDTIGRRAGPDSAVLPVAIVPPDMTQAEAKRRCGMMQQAMVEHNHRHEGDFALPMLLSGADNEILQVNRGTGDGVDRLQETIQAIGSDTSKSVFHHVGTQVPPGTVEVLDLIRHFKEQHKLILIDHLLGAIGESMEVDQVLKALQFLSNVGEILYFTADDDVLSRYIVLSRKWLVSALSCILRNDLKRELSEARRFMNMQCIYSDHMFTESQVIRTLVSGTMSSCPLLSDNDSKMLWQQMSFMREAMDNVSELSESSTSTPTMFYFLERLLVHTGIFLPLECSDESALEKSNVFFVPSLLAQADPGEVWSYKSSESWMTSLCHSWLFRDGAPSNLMERLTVKVLSDLYTFAQSFQGGSESVDFSLPERARTVPLRLSSLNEFMEDHNSEALGRVKLHQIVCWRSSLLIKIGTVFADPDSGKLRESFVEVFVAIVDQSAPHCVASDAMRASMQRVVVSGKGQVGHHGRKIWKGGYQVILQSVRDLLSNFSNVDSQVICPECLAHSNPRSASTWSWDSVCALAHSGEPVVRCMRGHGVDSNLIIGTSAERKPAPVADPSLTTHVGTTKHVSDILPSVVVVGLWDTNAKTIRSVGSGFVVDKKLGLIVTAGHVLFNMEGRRTDFGLPYFGIPDAKVVIGVIPDGTGHTAKFRYMGEIVVDDIQYVDACVVRIKTRMEHDVDDEGAGCADQAERILPLDAMPGEKLRALKTTTRFELEERVRVLGFNQGGEGVYEKGRHVNRSADFASGYICRRFQNPTPDDSSSSDSSSHMSFSPREEVVIMCPTISGHSGGPCVNNDGKVIGILSRADPVDRQRCYLVPASELKPLITKAKKLSNWRREDVY